MATKQSPVDDVLDMLARIQEMKQPAIDALLAQRSEIDEKLALLGYAPSPIPRQQKTPRSVANSNAGGTTVREKADRPCPICNFRTDILHDSRSHRSQNPKRPFTDAELAERGWTRIS